MPDKKLKIKAAVLPDDFEKIVKKQYEELDEKAKSFDEFKELVTNEFAIVQSLQAQPQFAYKPSPIPAMTPCGNGDLEKELDPTQWQGAYGYLNPRPPVNFQPNVPYPFANFIEGFQAGPIGSQNSHQTWVGTGTDPNVGISTTAPSSTGAVRLGNNSAGYGCELISKTFIVPPQKQKISFWYAVVLQNPPRHSQTQQPFFWVRVTDQNGTIVPGAMDFGNGSDVLVADRTNPLFQTKGRDVVYRDWSCAQIDLSSMVGKQVTIEFVSGDCGRSAHYGYAYIDRYCGDCSGSPAGNLDYNCEASSHCGEGKICFDYELPKIDGPAGSPITGEVEITLDFYQDGNNLNQQVSSGVLSSGSQFCFLIDPATIAGLDMTKPGFDFVANARFTINNIQIGTLSVGSAPDGVNSGTNNDYKTVCETCEIIRDEQDEILSDLGSNQVNTLPHIHCHCGDGNVLGDGKCDCKCEKLEIPKIKPCISIKWGSSQCECFETDDTEIVTITVSNCYSNVTLMDLSIGRIVVTDLQGNPVPTLPDGTPSVRLAPTGPICFGDIGPCTDPDQPGKVTRDIMIETRGAKGGAYKLAIEGICFKTCFAHQEESCFLLKLCQD